MRFNLWTKGETSDKKPVAPVNDLISLLKGNLSIDVNKLTIAEAATQAFDFFLAGYETSATTASYCLN